MPTYIKLSQGEVEVLVARQFPDFKDLTVRPVSSAGTDHDLYRLGEDKLIRLPRVDWAAGQAEKEFRWLPLLAPHLPLAIPSPLLKGQPDETYPWDWSIYTWLDGANAKLAPPSDLQHTALELGAFVSSLHSIRTDEGPKAGKHNFRRGIPLQQLDELVRRSLTELGDRINSQPVISLWEQALAAPPADTDTWVHGDLHGGNMLTLEGSLNAIIDFGGLGVGDPACDLIVAWNMLNDSSREVFRTACPCDDAMWLRGRGWAVYTALVALPHYWDSNPSIVEDSWYTLSNLFPGSDIRP